MSTPAVYILDVAENELAKLLIASNDDWRWTALLRVTKLLTDASNVSRLALVVRSHADERLTRDSSVAFFTSMLTLHVLRLQTQLSN